MVILQWLKRIWNQNIKEFKGTGGIKKILLVVSIKNVCEKWAFYLLLLEQKWSDTEISTLPYSRGSQIKTFTTGHFISREEHFPWGSPNKVVANLRVEKYRLQPPTCQMDPWISVFSPIPSSNLHCFSCKGGLEQEPTSWKWRLINLYQKS